MAQFIQYLYEYENGQRVRNLGFMKVDKQMDKTVIQIYAKQLDEVSGIQFQREDGSRYFATWEEEGEQLPQQTPPTMRPPQEQTPSTMRPPLQEPAMQEPTMQEPPVQEPPMQEPPMQEPPMQEPPMQRSPMPQMQETPQQTPPTTRPPQQQTPPTMRPPQQQTPQQQQMQNEAEGVSAYIPPNTRHYEKIQRQDLSRLPRREWRLANNSFLLHGFYNYHHLLYIEDGDKIWIGVPGIYHEKEKAAANAFGFPEFQRLTDMELELSDEEKNTYDDFGYWCRKVNI